MSSTLGGCIGRLKSCTERRPKPIGTPRGSEAEQERQPVDGRPGWEAAGNPSQAREAREIPPGGSHVQSSKKVINTHLSKRNHCWSTSGCLGSRRRKCRSRVNLGCFDRLISGSFQSSAVVKGSRSYRQNYHGALVCLIATKQEGFNVERPKRQSHARVEGRAEAARSPEWALWKPMKSTRSQRPCLWSAT